ncbi:MAG: hypothetical protein HUU50_00145 [Candidatus Brocadiae bacterium]|nr:hypothetical protein [Candidatus Brocadiia bacterium]
MIYWPLEKSKNKIRTTTDKLEIFQQKIFHRLNCELGERYLSPDYGTPFRSQFAGCCNPEEKFEKFLKNKILPEIMDNLEIQIELASLKFSLIKKDIHYVEIAMLFSVTDSSNSKSIWVIVPIALHRFPIFHPEIKNETNS